jgi:hypothetical protein
MSGMLENSGKVTPGCPAQASAKKKTPLGSALHVVLISVDSLAVSQLMQGVLAPPLLLPLLLDVLLVLLLVLELLLLVVLPLVPPPLVVLPPLLLLGISPQMVGSLQTSASAQATTQWQGAHAKNVRGCTQPLPCAGAPCTSYSLLPQRLSVGVCSKCHSYGS